MGPLLYTLITLVSNDLPSVCYPCSIKIYADDIKICYVIRHESDKLVLQLCLNIICDWASIWELKFLFDKYQLLQIGYNNLNISCNLGSRIKFRIMSQLSTLVSPFSHLSNHLFIVL